VDLVDTATAHNDSDIEMLDPAVPAAVVVKAEVSPAKKPSPKRRCTLQTGAAAPPPDADPPAVKPEPDVDLAASTADNDAAQAEPAGAEGDVDMGDAQAEHANPPALGVEAKEEAADDGDVEDDGEDVAAVFADDDEEGEESDAEGDVAGGAAAKQEGQPRMPPPAPLAPMAPVTLPEGEEAQQLYIKRALGGVSNLMADSPHICNSMFKIVNPPILYGPLSSVWLSACSLAMCEQSPWCEQSPCDECESCAQSVHCFNLHAGAGTSGPGPRRRRRNTGPCSSGGTSTVSSACASPAPPRRRSRRSARRC
jgi:hypothetical protein